MRSRRLLDGDTRPIKLDVRFRRMLLRIIAILAAPVLLAFFFVATTPSDAQVRPAVLWVGYYLMAHLFFWPPLLGTSYLARRFALKSPLHVAAVMAACSIVMTSALGLILYVFLNMAYTWRTGLRDAIVEAVASVGSLWLYVGILGWGRQTPVGAAPNNRWSGP